MPSVCRSRRGSDGRGMAVMRGVDVVGALNNGRDWGGERGDFNQGGRGTYLWMYTQTLPLITVTAVKLCNAARGA